MSKGLETFDDIKTVMTKLFGGVERSDKALAIIEKELKTLEILKDICLEGKDKYGEGTWGWVEFDLDKEPKLKEWLKDEY